MDPRLFHHARETFFARNQTSFLTSGFESLLTTSIPLIVQKDGTITTLINSLLYTFSLTNVKVCNSGLTPTMCLKHALTYSIPIVADLELKVHPHPLLADLQVHKPVVLSKVRSVVWNQPICTGVNALTTSATLDEDMLNRTLPDGIFIARGHMRTIPCLKAMFPNTILLREKKKFYQLQVRSGRDGNRSLEEGNPFRSTSSIQFEVEKKRLKRHVLEGVITCKLPFPGHKIHIGVLAQAFGCEPARFVELVKSLAGADYDAAHFRAYETSILTDERVLKVQAYSIENNVPLQDAAIMALSKLSDKDKEAMSPGVNLLKTEIFPHLNVMFQKNNQCELYFTKLLYLALCTCRLVLFIARKIPETSRDLWQFTNVHMPAFQLGTLIRSKFQDHMDSLKRLLRRELKRIARKPPDLQHHVDLVKLFKSQSLSDSIEHAILTGEFRKNRVGAAIPLNDNNLDAMWTQLFRISSSMSTTDAVNTNPRKLPKDAYGYSCAGATPDGEQVGLINETACTNYITCDVLDPCALSDLLLLLLKRFLKPIVQTLHKTSEEGTTEQQHLVEPTTIESKEAPASSALVDEDNLHMSVSVKLLRSLDFDRICSDVYLFINNCGVPTHFVDSRDVQGLVCEFQKLRRLGSFPRHTFISVTHHPREIRIMAEGGQMTRPLIVLENIHRVNPTMSFEDMVHQGAIEWVNPAEEQTVCKGKIVMCFDDLKYAISKNEDKNLTHMEFSQAAFVGVLAASVVFLTGEQGPRLAIYQHQKKQVMDSAFKPYRGSVLSTRTWYPHADLVFTEVASMIAGAKDGRGFPCNVLINADRNQEDGLVIQKEAAERGMFAASTTRHYTSDLLPPKSGETQRFEKPKDVLSKKNLRYDTVQEDGFPHKRQRISPHGDVVIGKTRTTRRSNHVSATVNAGPVSAASTSATPSSVAASPPPTRVAAVSKRCISQVSRRNEGGQVVDVEQNATPFGKRARVAVESIHLADEIGNKYTTDKGQKGVCGRVQKAIDCPFDERTGMIPEVMMGMVGLISRMTMATEVEGLLGKAAAIDGQTDLGIDHHNYNDPECVQKLVERAGDILAKAGWQRTGAHWMRCGKTGHRFLAPMFMGIIKYEALVHLASGKLHYSAEGPRCPLTRQPKQGKRLDGGLRFGEQEWAAALAQGASALIQSRVRDLSDPFEIFVCKQCHMLADGNKRTNYAWCRACQRRDTVCIVKVPFTFHLNLFELMTIGIKVGIHVNEVKSKQPKLLMCGM